MKKTAVITTVICLMLVVVMIGASAQKLLEDIPSTPGINVVDKVSHMSGDSGMTPNEAEIEPPPEPVTITLSFIGDCMLATDRGAEWEGSFNLLAKQVEPSYFFDEFGEIFQNDDWTVANLENVFTDNPNAKMRGKGYSPAYWYRSTTANTAILTEGGIDIVSLSNNHSQDYGDIGYEDTRTALDEAGVIWGDNDKIIMLEKEGFTIALYATTFYYTGYDKIISDKMAALEADYKIVYFHGGTERIHVPDEWKAAGCRRMIDNGIDLVVGHHPHVLQPIEVYNGKTIIHSLGNFVFGGSRSEENRTIVYQHKITLVEGEITEISEHIIPCYVYTELYKPGIITDEDEIAALNAFLNGESKSPMNK